MLDPRRRVGRVISRAWRLDVESLETLCDVRGERNMAARTSRQTDVVIVGSGAVGVAAGLEAQEAGAQVIVIEKEAQLGGAAAISSGGCCCVDTRLQREQGIADSPDLAFEDWIRWGEGAADEAWARF